VQSLEDVAKELLRDESLRTLDPEEAAREWLARGACSPEPERWNVDASPPGPIRR
jgi:hypothetical protein